MPPDVMAVATTAAAAMILIAVCPSLPIGMAARAAAGRALGAAMLRFTGTHGRRSAELSRVREPRQTVWHWHCTHGDAQAREARASRGPPADWILYPAGGTQVAGIYL